MHDIKLILLDLTYIYYLLFDLIFTMYFAIPIRRSNSAVRYFAPSNKL